MRGRGETGRRRRLKIAFPWSAGSSPAVRTILLAALALGGCDARPDTGAVIVSAIGRDAPAYRDPSRLPLDTPDRLLTGATAQGLVRFDAAGQIEPGLAERWIVIDDGTTFIFRLREANWADGAPVTAEDVVAILRRQIAPGSRNPLTPFLTAIDTIVVMTPQVIEVQLKRPRPDLLKLFAQPELAILRLRPAGGSGPMRVQTPGPAPLLRPLPDPTRTDPDDPPRRRPEDDVRLIGERAARAIIRFAAHRSDLVEGGSFADWPLVARGNVPPATIRLDPAAGLFGLAVTSRDGFLADVANRAAVAGAIDTAAATDAVMSGWSVTAQILPEQLDAAAAPVAAPWADQPLADRIGAARARVASWPGGAIALRVAMPAGPGANLLFGSIAASLRRIGIAALRVPAQAAADLRLVDAVAPYDSARWYLATACQPCSAPVQARLEAARDAPTPVDRAQRLTEADAALAQDAAFVPIARPLRWSLVAPRLRQWQGNARAWHPLNRLRGDTTS